MNPTTYRLYALAFVGMFAATITLNIAMNSGSWGWSVTTAVLAVLAVTTFLLGSARDGRD